MTSSTELARTLVAALVDAGVREVVLCPGSRSSAMAYAVAEAERAGHLRLHVRVDERSAGFLALGLAKVSRVPGVVITTSGTAVANLHPAVLEAHHALVPLIVLSCDRPAELRGTGANQTTIQPGIFGTACRFEVDLSAPLTPDAATAEGSSVALEIVSRTVGRAVASATAPHAEGPVHLNVQFREPLVPDLGDFGDLGDADAGTAAACGNNAGTGALAGFTGTTAAFGNNAGMGGAGVAGTTAALGNNADTGAVVGLVGTTAACGNNVGVRGAGLPVRTLVVLGDVPTLAEAQAVLDWADAQALPVLAEPFGPHPRPGVVQHGVLVAGVSTFVDAHAPAGIVVAGRPTLSRPFTGLLRRSDAELVVIDTGLEFEVPGRSSTRVPIDELSSLTVGGAPADGTSQWRSTWLAAGHRVADAVNSAPPKWPTGPAIARVMAEALPAGAVLFLGSSNSPRDLDIATTMSAQVDVIASRGLAGIDGCVATAIGIAVSRKEIGHDQGGAPLPARRSTYALMGDLTFLHDTNGLLIGPDEPVPDLTIVVANDDGGGIFTTLEPGEPDRARDFDRLFGTPTGTDLATLCQAHGIRHQRVETPADLAAALAISPAGLRVVEVSLDRSTHRAERARLHALAAAALLP